nr:nodulation protein [Melilotus officinalis]
MSSSSSSSSTPQWIYDVFLSFRGEDTRRTFVAYLHDNLSKAGINTYIDNRLQKGTELGPELLAAIDGSRISIIVFSKNFHTSSWCLKELEHIMKCRRNYGQVVVPVFYHVDPSVLRHHTGDFGEVLQETATKSSSGWARRNFVLSTWKIALTEVANISGWHTKNFRDDVELTSQIVKDVKIKRNKILLNITEFPVGLGTRVHKVIHFIENQSSKVCLIGIWGMGGLGKTTTARAIYNKFQCKFVDHSFIANIRHVCEESGEGIIHLQEQLLANILKTNEKIYDTASGITKIKDAFMGKKALIVLDDVSTSEQIEALCGNRKCFGPGSVLIVTSRDVRILKLLKVDRIYSIKEMDENKSLKLFSWHAFGEPRPKRDFGDLSKSIVNYCGGLPFALKTIGDKLRDRPKQEWISELSKLEKIPNYQLLKKLEISYDGLKEDHEKSIFLDICCFFIGKERAYVSEILDGCQLHAGAGIPILIERGLLKVEKNNKLGMHDLLRDLGREIVHKRSMEEHGNHRRLWFHEDAHKVLTENTGTKTVEGLVLTSQSTNSVDINTTFKEMKNLRLLQLDRVGLTGDFKSLSQELRWLHWQGFTRECIPDEFYLGKLVVFELEHSNIKQVWKETKLLENLKILNLSHSNDLKSTPDFSKLPNLEKLIMEDCPNLSELHPSIGDLKNILLINLKDCTSLSNLPEKIYQLTSLTTLILSGCSKIDKLEEGIVQMKSLTTLIIKDTGFQQPYSIVRLESIRYISLCGSERTSDVFHQVRDMLLSLMPPFGNMASSLAPINVQNNNSGFLSPIESFSQLRTVWIQCHSEIQLTQEFGRILDDQASQISNRSTKSLLFRMASCHLAIDKSISQGLTSNGSSNFFLPVANHSSWLACIGEGPSALFQVPKNIDCDMEGIILRVVYSSKSENIGDDGFAGVLIINYTKCTIHIYKRDTVMSFNGEDWKNVTSNLGPGDDVKIYVAFEHGLIVEKTIVYLISGQSIVVEVDDPNMEMEPSPKPNKRMFTRRLPNRMGECVCLNQHTDIGLGACLCLNHNTDG